MKKLSEKTKEDNIVFYDTIVIYSNKYKREFDNMFNIKGKMTVDKLTDDQFLLWSSYIVGKILVESQVVKDEAEAMYNAKLPQLP